MFNARQKKANVLIGQGLTLNAEANERESNDVWVSDRKDNISSYQCAIDSGYLNDVYELSQSQLEWLNSQVVQDWLDSNNY